MECLQAGLYYGFGGQVDRIVERMVEEIGPVRAVIATGGLAWLVKDECHTLTAHEPMITLIGLRMVYERNV